MPLLAVLVATLALATFEARSQPAPAVGVHRLSEGALKPGSWQREGIPASWRFHHGDDPRWARPDLEHDDGAWQAIHSTFKDGLPRGAWTGVGWFRLWVEVPARLRGVPLAVQLNRFGALEVYVDGERRLVRGDVEAAKAGRAAPMSLSLAETDRLVLDGARHLIAVRFASPDIQRLNRLGMYGGFSLSLTRLREGTAWWRVMERYALNLNFFFVGATCALSALHLLLFAFYRGRRENLFFGLASLGTAGIALGTVAFSSSDDVQGFLAGYGLFGASIAFSCAFLLRHAYEVFLSRVPRYYWGIVAAAALAGATTWILPRWVIYTFAGLAFLEMGRVLLVGLVRRVDGAWIIASGGVFSIVCTGLTMLGDLSLIWVPNMLYLYGFLGLMASISIHLARGFARDKHDLVTQLTRNEELAREALAQERRAHAEAQARHAAEADNARQELELQEARKREAVLRELERANQELREAQIQLVQSERRAALGELLAGVAHEINSPVGALTSVAEASARCGQKIRGALEEAASLDEARGSPRLVKALRVLDESSAGAAEAGARITGLLRSLTAFAGLDRAELGRADLHAGIESALDLLAPRMAGRIGVARDFGELPEIICYAAELNQVFANLLKNACDAIDGGGRGRGEIRIRTAVVGEQARLAFCDDGPGMTDEQLAGLFDFRLSGEGGRRVRMGMGLKVAHAVMERHGGGIEAARNAAGGMTFTLTLPVDGSALLDGA